MKSHIISKLDHLYHNYQYITEDELWKLVDQVFQNDQEVLISIDYFLAHLTDNHDIPGNVWYKLTGIGDWIRQGIITTQKQERFVVMSLIAYWDQRDLLVF